jgi:hypothetical protein
MDRWVKDILGYNYVDDDSSYLWGEETILEKAQTSVENGGVALLGIDAYRFDTSPNWHWAPNHYIAFVGNFEVTNGAWYDWSASYSFKYWSWAVTFDKTIGEARLEDSLFGATFGE